MATTHRNSTSRTSRFERPGILAFLAMCVVLAACGGPQTAQDYFDQGAEHFQDGDYDEAIASYQSGLELEPRSPVGYNLLGMAYRMKFNAGGDAALKEQEIAAFTQAIEADSTFFPAQINLGASLYYTGRTQEAARHFHRALELDPQNPERKQLESMIRDGGMEPPRKPAG